MSKLEDYKDRVLELKGEGLSSRKIAGKLEDEFGVRFGKSSINYAIERWIGKEEPAVSNTTVTSNNDYSAPRVLSALDDNHKLMDIDRYCEYYNLPRKDITSYKLITHTGIPYYNLVCRELVMDLEFDYDTVKQVIELEIKREYDYVSSNISKINKPAVLKWADLHFGAHIRNLILTRDYDSNILHDGLLTSVDQTNDFGFNKVHVHINGDLIESFSGLNHINSWMSMNPEEIGANAVIMCTELLHKALSRIKNLGEVKIVAGNHDRTSKANDEDVKGGAAELIAWGLTLKGYTVEFHPYITTHLVEGINHINLHGDKGISRRSTKDIIWDYGKKGYYNFVFEAHLHALIEKMTVSQIEKFRIIRDDSIDHRRMHLQSFFTGNYYSETLNFNSNAGYCIVWDNGKGLPQVFSGCV